MIDKNQKKDTNHTLSGARITGFTMAITIAAYTPTKELAGRPISAVSWSTILKKLFGGNVIIFS